MNEMTPQATTSKTPTPQTMTTRNISTPQKSSRLFYLFPALYVLSTYLMPFFFFQQENLPLLSLLMYAPIIFAICNIIVSVKYAKPEYQNTMLNSMVLVKYSLILFFILSGVLVLICLILSIFQGIAMIFTIYKQTIRYIKLICLILIGESPYTISYLYIAGKTEKNSILFTAIHSLLQFCFILDVLSVMYLTLRAKRWRKLTLTLLTLFAAAIILLFIFIIF